MNRLLIPLDDMYEIRHLFNISLEAFNEELERYMQFVWRRHLGRKLVLINGKFEERLFVPDPNKRIFIDVEAFLKRFDQRHFGDISMDEMMGLIRREIS